MSRMTLMLVVTVAFAMSVFAVETHGLRDKIPALPETAPSIPAAPEPKRSGPSEPESKIGALIKQLGDPTWQVREDATQKLIAIGTPARGELLKAARSQDAEVAARAQRALTKIPWAVNPNDSAEVRELMADYEGKEIDDRLAVVGGLVGLGRSKCIEPLIRIVDLDADEELAITVADELQSLGIGPSGSAVRKYHFENERPASLSLRGWAWRLHQPKQAIGYLQKVLHSQEPGAAMNA